MLDPRPVGYIIGLLVAAMGGMMLFPLALDYMSDDPHWLAFAQSALITVLSGLLVALACANGAPRGQGLSLQQSFMLTAGVWVALPLFGALPFMLGAPSVGLTDAMFESVSGMTTTGTTVFVGLDALPLGVNLWRGILQWLGGLGIVIVAMIFLPVMKVGGMQFFRSEGFDTLGKILPRALDISTALIQIYLLLTLACFMVYFALGMSAFEALVLTLCTVSTGGFTMYDASFAPFAGAAEYASVVFMLLASLPFIRYVQLAQGMAAPLWRDAQVRAYLRWNGYAIGLIVLHELIVRGQPFWETLRESTFNVVSTFSGTGFTSVDLTLWGPFPFVVLVVAGLIGGCTSSTSCSIKVFRFLILIEAMKVQIRRLQNPNAIIFLDYEGRRVGEDVISSVILFFTMFILSFGILTVALSLTGLQTITAVTAAWTSIANVGPAFGPEVGATGAVHGFPDSAKWLMLAGMLVGRLELLAVYVMFMPRFWRA